MEKMEDCFTHSFREGNGTADKLANLGASAFSFVWWFVPLADVLPFVLKDSHGLPGYRFKK